MKSATWSGRQPQDREPLRHRLAHVGAGGGSLAAWANARASQTEKPAAVGTGRALERAGDATC